MKVLNRDEMMTWLKTKGVNVVGTTEQFYGEGEGKGICKAKGNLPLCRRHNQDMGVPLEWNVRTRVLSLDQEWSQTPNELF